MLTPLLARKLARDLVAQRGRVVMMIVALAVSVTALGAVLGARAILAREMSIGYLSTNPASATLHVPGGANAAALLVARSRPGVLDAALRARSSGRMTLVSGRRAPILLFVAPPADSMRVAGVRVEQGSWPPADGALLLERSSLAYFGLHAGDRIGLQMRAGRSVTVRVAGAVHDGAVAPSNQEDAAYGYATPALLAQLGEPPLLDELKIVVGDDAGHGGAPSASRRRIDAVAQDVGAALRARGIVVTHIDAPPPLRHPHQAQMETATGMLLAFALLALVLSAMLAAATLGAMLARQTRQIGVLKTLGASNATVLRAYTALTACIAVAATLLALVPAAFAARALARIVGTQFGIDLTSSDVPWAVALIEVAAGVVIPVWIAYGPLGRATSVTVREAIDGTSRGASFGTNRAQRALARWNAGGRTLRLALRNVVRDPDRLKLVVFLLGTSGAMFVSALAAAAGLQAVVDEGMSHRRYDLTVTLDRAEDAASVARAMAGVPGVAAFEAAASAPATIPGGGAIDVTRTYPDGGHGSFVMTSIQPNTALVGLPLLQGRALRGDDAGAVTFNQLVIPQQAPGARVGEPVSISLDGRVARYVLVGIVSDFGSPATAYVTPAGFARASGERDTVSLVRVVTQRHDGAAQTAAAAAIRQRFTNAGIALRGVTPVGRLKVVLQGHALVLAQTLGAIAVVMAIAGIFGLGSAVASGVLERTREFGVMRALGASSRNVAAIVVAEGLLYGVASALAALLASIPLTLLLDWLVGSQTFGVRLPFVLPVNVLALTAIATLGVAAVASAAGALSAARLTVRDALAAA